MSESRCSQDDLTCPVCLELLKDPVNLNCGHSYCNNCITGCSEQEGEKRVYSCPQCKETCSPRPALSENPILAGMVEKLNKPKRPADSKAGAGDVQCDACTGRKCKAIKFCLECQKFYCETHFGHHEEFHCRNPHKVIDATGRMQDMICRKHEKELKMYCITDQQYICGICKEYEHKKHKTTLTSAQMTEKQSQVTGASVSAGSLPLAQALSPATPGKTEKHSPSLGRRPGAIKDRRFQSPSAPPESTDVSCSFLSFDGVGESVHQLKVKQEDLCKEENQISVRVTQNKPLLKEPLKDTYMDIVPKTRRDFQKYSQQLTVDLNTVNKYLCLSESNRVIINVGFHTAQSYPDHPDRFDCWYQVLCRERVSGRCYWETEWCRHVFISVSYKSISRKGRGNEGVFGHNDQSWSLVCSTSRYSFIHNDIKTDLTLKPISKKIGVYVDHSAGILYFYSISDNDTMSLIHTVHTTFTQPLYPGFGFYAQSAVKI